MNSKKKNFHVNIFSIILNYNYHNNKYNKNAY